MPFLCGIIIYDRKCCNNCTGAEVKEFSIAPTGDRVDSRHSWKMTVCNSGRRWGKGQLNNRKRFSDTKKHYQEKLWISTLRLMQNSTGYNPEKHDLALKLHVTDDVCAWRCRQSRQALPTNIIQQFCGLSKFDWMGFLHVGCLSLTYISLFEC